MNIDRDKLIEMAKEAGFPIYNNNSDIGLFTPEAITLITEELIEFASLVSAHAITSMQGDSEPIAWESTTEAYKKYITQKQYDTFNSNFQKWYKPYKCSSCNDRVKGVSDSTLSVNEEYEQVMLFATDQETAYILKQISPDKPLDKQFLDCKTSLQRVLSSHGNLFRKVEAISQDKGESV